MNDEELIERIINLNYREFGAEVGNDLKRIIIKKEQKEQQLQSNWNSLREFVIQLQKLKGINQQGFSWGVAQEVLDKINELEGGEDENN